MTTPQEILSDGAETYEQKNDDYGDSWRKVGEILHELADGEPVTLETPEDHIAYGLLTRRLDKIARAYHGELLADELNFESVTDSHEDEAVYAAMSASNQQARDDNRFTHQRNWVCDNCQRRVLTGKSEPDEHCDKCGANMWLAE